MQKAHNTCRQSWIYLDNNGTVTYKTVIQHNMHITSTNNITINIKQLTKSTTPPSEA